MGWVARCGVRWCKLGGVGWVGWGGVGGVGFGFGWGGSGADSRMERSDCSLVMTYVSCAVMLTSPIFVFSGAGPGSRAPVLLSTLFVTTDSLSSVLIARSNCELHEDGLKHVTGEHAAEGI